MFPLLAGRDESSANWVSNASNAHITCAEAAIRSKRACHSFVIFVRQELPPDLGSYHPHRLVSLADQRQGSCRPLRGVHPELDNHSDPLKRCHCVIHQKQRVVNGLALAKAVSNTIVGPG